MDFIAQPVTASNVLNSLVFSTTFVVYSDVFLTSPTVDELQVLDMPVLIDMLAYQTRLHVQLLKEEGLSNTAKTCKQCIKNIQMAIEMKRNMEKNSTDTGSNISFAQDSTT